MSLPTPTQQTKSWQEAIRLADERAASFRDALVELLKIPSISGNSSHTKDVQNAAEWVRAYVAQCGLDVELLPTEGSPIVYGERRGKSDSPTVLIYGHYDVQPVEPRSAWDQDPFDPVVRDGNVIARGATDDKGQCLALLCGLQIAFDAGLGDDVTVKVLIEGEEEVGSPSLVPFIRENKEKLAADAVIISDSSQLTAGIPAITCGLRGIMSMELVLRGAKQDLHSGSYGGAVANPANVLTRIMNACQEPFGKIAIPGFYDRVRDLEDHERAAFAALPITEEDFLREVGAPKLWGEEGFSSLERKWARPTFDINGLVSGHTGEGGKTVLPAEACAKFSMRLVPDQDADEIARLTEEFLLSLVPDCVTAEVHHSHGAAPVLVSCDSDLFRAAERAVETGFGQRPVLIREGGSIPVVNTFKAELGIDSILIGLGLPDDGAHAPNEKFSLDDFQRGVLTMAAMLGEASGADISKSAISKT